MLLSILAFLALSGPLLLYTFGYRFSLSNFDIHKTGGVFAHTNPSGTNITINDTQRTTSYLTGNAFIQNLRPGSYTAEITRKGYQTWEKTIDVEPQTVIELFPVLMPNTPVIIALQTASSTRMSASPNASILILHQEKNSRHLYEFFDPETRVPLLMNTPSQTLMASVPPNAHWRWNAEEMEAVIETPDNWLLFTRQGNTIRVQSLYRTTSLAKLFPKKPRALVPDPRNKNHYFLLDGTDFVRWNTQTKKAQQLLQSIGGFFVSNAQLILWDTQSSIPYITSLDATQARPFATTSVASVSNARIEETNGRLLLSGNTDLWLWENSASTPSLLTDSLTPEHILHTNAYILWWDEKTINIYWTGADSELPSFQKIRKETIYESDGHIQQVVPYPQEQYLILQEDNVMYTLELDGRGEMRTKQIVYKGENPSFHASPGEKTMYVLDDGALFAIELP